MNKAPKDNAKLKEWIVALMSMKSPFRHLVGKFDSPEGTHIQEKLTYEEMKEVNE